jgi:hypothetical protein
MTEQESIEQERKKRADKILRDQFAMAALTGLIFSSEYYGEGVCIKAYYLADLMMAAREAK